MKSRSAVVRRLAIGAAIAGAVFVVAPGAIAAPPSAPKASAPPVLSFNAAVFPAAGPVTAPPAPSAPAAVSARGAIVVNGATGAALWGKAADTKRPMASTTKIMTALVVLETKGLDLNRLVTVKQEYRDYVAAQGASTADLRTGDKLTVRQLLYGMLLPSGCDAAYALADTFGTGATSAARRTQFIAQMNAKAKALGLKDTAFDSFDGISSTNSNYATPRALATLTARALKNTTFAAVVSSATTTQKATASNGGTRTYTWINTNQLLGAYQGVIGVKTGTSTAAGPCFVFAAKRNGTYVVGVVLSASSVTERFNDARKIMDWAFGVKPAANGLSVATLKLRQLPPGMPRD